MFPYAGMHAQVRNLSSIVADKWPVWPHQETAISHKSYLHMSHVASSQTEPVAQKATASWILLLSRPILCKHCFIRPWIKLDPRAHLVSHFDKLPVNRRKPITEQLWENMRASTLFFLRGSSTKLYTCIWLNCVHKDNTIPQWSQVLSFCNSCVTLF